jgi:hypothetical protein
MGLLDDAIKEHLDLKRRRGADAGEISRLESEALGPVHRSADGVPDLSDTFVPPTEAATADAPPPSLAPEDEHTAFHGAPQHAPAYEPPPPAHESRTAPPRAQEPPLPSSQPLYESPPVMPPPTREAWMTEPDPEPDEPAAADDEPEPEPTGLLSRLRVGRRHRSVPQREPTPPEPPAALDSRPVPPAPAHEPPPAPPPSDQPAPPAVQHEPDIVPADDEPEAEDLLEDTPEFLEETPEHDRLWFEQRPPRDFDFDG